MTVSCSPGNVQVSGAVSCDSSKVKVYIMIMLYQVAQTFMFKTLLLGVT